MAEPTTPNTTPTTPDPKPDWIVSTLSGQLKSPTDLTKSGLKAADFNFADDPSTYWAKGKVKEIFEDNEDAFKSFYTKEKDKYENTKISDKELDIQLTAAVPKGGSKPYVGYSYNTKIADIYGRNRVGEFYSPKKHTIQSNAIDQGVKIGDKYTSVDTFDGVVRLAKDDQGQLKLNESNRPYWEPIKDGEELRSFDETYSKVADWAGMYGVDRSYTKELGYSVFKAIPNFLTKMSDSMLEIGRIPLEMVDNPYARRNAKEISDIQTNLRGWEFPTSSHSQEGGFFDPVNLFDLGLDVTLQLLSMGGVAKTAAALGANAANQSRAGLLYMTGLSAGSIAQVSREAGLNPYETAVMYGINAAAIYRIAGLSDMVIHGVRPLEFTQNMDKMLKGYGVQTATAGLSSSAMKSYYNKVSDGMSRLITTMAAKPGMTSGFFLEALEESTEQVVDSGTRGLYNIVSPLYSGDGHFNWDPGLEFEGLIQAAIGGGIGGAIGSPLMKRLGFQNRQMIDDIESGVAFNDEAFVFRMIDKWEKQGKMGQTQEENARNAAMMRNVTETMVGIRDRAGLKDVISNNERLAGKFASLLRESSIGRDKIVLGNDLNVLENQLLDVQKQTDPDAVRMEKLQAQIAKKKLEISNLNEGVLLPRYIAEGAYNIHSDPELSQGTSVQIVAPPDFNGRLFADMNKDAIDSFQSRKESYDKTVSAIGEVDSKATFEDFSTLGISKEGKNRLLGQAVASRDAVLSTVAPFVDEIDNLPVQTEAGPTTIKGLVGSVSNIWSEDSANALENIPEQLAAVDPALKVQDQPWYGPLNQLIELQKTTNEIKGYKDTREVPQAPNPDDFLFYDFEDGHSTMPIQDRIDSERKLQDSAVTPGGLSTYISDNPDRLLKVTMNRAAQLEGLISLKYNGPYPDLQGPEIDTAKIEEYVTELSQLLGQLNELKAVSEANRNNTETRVLEVYMERLNTYHKYLRHMARKLPESRQGIVDLIDDADLQLQTALDTKDADLFGTVLFNLEQRLYTEFGGDAKVDKILSEIHPGSQKGSEYDLEKGAYNYMRRVLSVPALEMEKARLEYVTELIGEQMPTMEQQDTAMQVLRDAISGVYNYDPGIQNELSLSHTAAIDGSGGSGKTAFVIPMLVSMAYKTLKGKVMVTASPDVAGSKVNRVRKDLERSFGKKPDYVKYSDKSLLDILKSTEINDVNLIIYDEASLIPGKQLVEINSKLKEINIARQTQVGVSPLHIVYTYDGLQNGWTGPNDKSAYSINSKRFHKPTPPRMTFSFRQTNEPLNAIENLFKDMMAKKGLPTQVYTYQHNSDFDGVTVVKTVAELESTIEALRSTKAAKNSADSIVYLKANEKVVPKGNAGLQTLTSLESQGSEWDYVIAHLDQLTNPADKAEGYTMVTRPKKGLILFAPNGLNINSIEGPVRPFTSMKPAPLQKQALSDVLFDRLGPEIDKPISFTPRNVTFRPPTRKDLDPIGGPEQEPADPSPGETAIELDESFQKALQGAIKPNGRIKGHTFFTGEGQMQAKKKMLFDEKYRADTKFFMTIAKINSPGYSSTIGEYTPSENEFGVFVEGFHGDERAVIAVLSLADITDKNIRTLPIYDASKDILLTQPISSDFVAKAMFKHPFVVNTQWNNDTKEWKDDSKLHSLDEFGKEIESKGIIASNILIATRDIKGKYDNTAVKEGFPFVVLNFNDITHPKSEFKRITEIENFNVDKAASRLENGQFRTFQLRKKKATFNEVVSFVKEQQGRYYDPAQKDSEKFWTPLGQMTLHSFWYNELSGKTSFYADIFQRVEDSFPPGSGVRLFAQKSLDTKQNRELKTPRSASYRAYLLQDMIQAEISGPASIKNYDSKKKIFDQMMLQPELKEGMTFSPIRAPKSKTSEALVKIDKDVDAVALKTFLEANYFRIDPPVVQFDKKDLAGLLDAKTDSGIPTLSGTDVNNNTVFGRRTPVTPMKFAQFLENFKALPGGFDPELARQAIRIFRKGIMDAHVVLEVANGATPGFTDINNALKKQRATWASEANEKTTAKSKQSLMHYAIGSNFNELLAEHFPAIAYDAKADAYSYDNNTHKTSTWTEQETEDLIATADSIIKTYLFNTPVRNGFFTPKHLSTILPLIHGRRFHNSMSTQRALTTDDVAEALASSNTPEAKALYNTYFAPTPVAKGNNKQSYSYRALGTEQGIKLADAIGLFLISGDSYVPGFSTVFQRWGYEGFDRTYNGDTRVQKYPVGYFLPSITFDRFVKSFGDILDKSNIAIDKDGVTLSGAFFPIETNPSFDETLRKIQATGLPGYSEENLRSWMDRDGDQVLKRFQGYFNASVKRFKKGITTEYLLGDPVSNLLDSYADDVGLGNSMSSLNVGNRRQNLLRTTAPIFHTHSVASKIRGLSDTSTILKDNLLISAKSKYHVRMGDVPAYVNNGIKVIAKGKERTKKVSKMSMSELLDVYMIDGYLSQLEKGEQNISFPVTVYADSSSEISPIFTSENWDANPDEVIDTLFASRQTYYKKLEKQILDFYRGYGINTSAIENINASSINMTELMKDPLAIAGIHYDPQSGVAALKQSLVADIKYYRDAGNIEAFRAGIDINVAELIEFSKSNNSTLRKTYDVVKADFADGNAAKANELFKKFYVNWLAMSTEFQKAFNGPEYQYSNYEDNGKRSRSLTSPAAGFLFRNDSWNREVAEWRTINPGAPLPARLAYEGKKLNRISKTYVVIDPEHIIFQPNGFQPNGKPHSLPFTDGATLVTPFTRIQQDYSTALSYGRFIGPIMKNVTHSVDPVLGAKTFIKNAEFEITPERLRNGNDQILNMFTRMVSIPFNTPVNGAVSALDLLTQLGVEPDFSNITREHFIKAMDMMVQAGEQDTYVQELVFTSSLKSAQRGINSLDDESDWSVTPVDITMKGTQQDAMKDPTMGLDTKVLTQLVNAIAINWVDDASLRSFYDNLSSVTKNYLDNLGRMDEKEREKMFERMTLDNIKKNDEVSARSQAAYHGILSINDRSTSGKYLETIVKDIDSKAISFPFKGGQYVLSPSFTNIYRATDNETGLPVRLLKSQFDPARYTLTEDPSRLAYVDAVREDRVTLTEAYATLGVEATHESLQKDNWTQGRAEILLPAEMEHEFMLTDALRTNTPIHQIDEAYFERQLSEALTPEKIQKNKMLAKLMFESFQLRLQGIMARIPTSGKHSAIITEIAGFMQESMNAVEVPTELYSIQGADQDIDKGSYLTYNSLVRYDFAPSNSKTGKVRKSYNPKYGESAFYNLGGKPTGIIPFIDNMEQAAEALGIRNADDKSYLNKVAIENTIVRDLNTILQNPKALVESSKSAGEIVEPWRKLKGEPQSKSYDNLMSLLQLHQDNQAGGTDLVGIFANGAKAYNVLYAAHKYNQREGKSSDTKFLAGLDTTTPNTIWETFSALINTSVDNAKLGINGALGINQYTAPYFSYLAGQGMLDVNNPNSIQQIKEEHAELFAREEAADHYNRKKAIVVGDLPVESRELFFKTQEWNLLSQSILNRELPIDMAGIMSFTTSLERFVNISYRDGQINSKFNLERFTNDPEYAKEQVEIYENLMQTSNNHSVNLLFGLNGIPHVKQYLRSLVAAHKMATRIKSYDVLSSIHRNAKLPKLKQYYYYNEEQFKDDYNFLEGYYIDSYLKSRDFSEVGESISIPEGRKKFIDDFATRRMPALKAAYPSNKLVHDLQYDKDQNLVRINDFYDINDELRSVYMSEMQGLSPADRNTLYVYSLITSRNSTAKGSIMPYFSFLDKVGFLNYLDFEMQVDAKKVSRALTLYNKEKDDSSIPYQSVGTESISILTTLDRPSRVVEGVDVYSVPHIEPKEGSYKPIPVAFRETDDRNIILVNQGVIDAMFKSKEWKKKVSIDGGTYMRAFKDNAFRNVDEYTNFMVFSLTSAMKGGRTSPTHSDMMAALKRIGKDPSYMFERVTEQKNDDNANECLIP